ncbi:abscisic stress-ripening protein [Trifolium repens]|nr:abscisic stress-ripening protein [Trifolium repens]
MAEEKHHHLFHHDEKKSGFVEEVDYKKQEKHHKNLEHLGELGTVAAGTYALHEKHEAKKDPENAHKHKIEEEIAAAAAVGSGGFAFHEKHDKKEAKKEDEEAHGKKHHLFR